MVFSTPLFIFGFMPIFLGLYYLVPFRHKSLMLLIFSYIFYGWWKASFLLLIFAMSLVSYLAATTALKGKTARIRKWAVIGGVSADLLILGYFKYFNFFAGNVNAVLQSADVAPYQFTDIILPIGISFHTFQSISYVIDVYRKDAPPARTLIDFLAFGSLFPQLIAGPVLRYKDVSDQFQNRIHSFDLFTQGLKRFFTGLAMKVLIADTLATLVDPIFALENPSFNEAWLGALAYTFQLFFDFAGYSSMAIGLGLMMGFRFIENFNHPYISQSITEFWRRWHISLSSWLRDYLYVPLGGNRRGKMRTYINLLLTMILGGFWHGANWTFILWGAWHGALMAVERALGAKSKTSVYPFGLGLPITFVFVVIGWVMFRAISVQQAFRFYHAMLGLGHFGISEQVYWQIEPLALLALGAAVGLCALPLVQHIKFNAISQRAYGVLYTPLVLVTLVKLIGQSNSPFLYFQF